MAKPKSRRVPSDDYVTMLDGETCAPHEGEWVEVVSGNMSMGELETLLVMENHTRDIMQQAEAEAAALAAGLTAPPDDPAALNKAYSDLCDQLALRVKNWNWTSPAGFPLPKPDGTPDPLKRLSPGELVYVRFVCMGEAPAERKNDGGDTPITSSDTTPEVWPISGTGLSLVKAS